MSKSRKYPANPDLEDSFNWLAFMPFVLMHVALIGIWWSGFTWVSLTICVVLYVARVFGITAGYH
ncbi:MAG TPA: hypothetical protein VK110_09485, partial [Salinisphaeraceae bacterium]|nr:hypothetical protein [Salinisphaeraceae bacterium]